MLMENNMAEMWDNRFCDDDNLTIDFQTLWDILEQKDEPPLQDCTEDLLEGKVQQGFPELETVKAEFAEPVAMSTSYSLGSLDSKRLPELETVKAEFAEPVAMSTSYSLRSLDSRSSFSDFSAECVENKFGYDHHEPSVQAGFPATGLVGDDDLSIHDFSSHEIDYYHESCHGIPNYLSPICFAPQDNTLDASVEKSDFSLVDGFKSTEHTARMSDKSETKETSSMDVPISWDSSGDFIPRFVPNNVDMINPMDGWEEFLSQSEKIHSYEMFETQVPELNATTVGSTLTEDSEFSRANVKCEDHVCTSLIKQRHNLDYGPMPMLKLLPHTPADIYRNKHLVPTKKETFYNLVTKGRVSLFFEGTHNKSCAANFPASQGLGQFFPPVLSYNSSKYSSIPIEDEKKDFALVSKIARQSANSIIESTNGKPNWVAGDPCANVMTLGQPYYQPMTPMKIPYGKNYEIMGETTQHQRKDAQFSKVGSQTTYTTATLNSFQVDNDPDACILEVPSELGWSSTWSINRNPFASQHILPISGPLNQAGMGGVKHKPIDEGHVLQVALQDLAQARTEVTPPDGLLAVPLLRHQRIALSWMVQKETACLNCSGGILADDQGLGKTISAIALIVKERSPAPSAATGNDKQNEREIYNLDSDDDSVSVLDGCDHDTESSQGSDESLTGGPSLNSNGRPNGGTLVVCPTSVLRQWADEFQNKLTSKAKLSVLVYHGNNRTKDPCELANYDVVLTTYSIISMQVPKQRLVKKDDDETGGDNFHSIPSSKKRKYPPTSEKSCMKSEPDNGPLTRVGWFRIVLDEAQIIKNRKTRVAHACWGLCAKHRWCLSGTPIQNSLDDLYSYFRFLRYEPYATYSSFRALIKVPISKNRVTGYKKLQAVLKTVMLRRTKGTLLDGEPIINLPPKTVELKKLDFTTEERDFYCRLESDSRDQFREYAAAGTVNQNYVNILLLLLRLRQACDHPLLASSFSSSFKITKKLPKEKQVSLLSCFEASSAICGICNDPPEYDVVTSCGHIFCNQCIHEHLTGEDDQCPVTNCNNPLSPLSIFRKTVLEYCLSLEPGQDGTPDNFSSESDKLASGSWGPSFRSSKIKAAVEVLESFSKPKDFPKNSVDPFEIVKDSSDMYINDDEGNNLEEGSKGLVEVAREKAIVFSQWTSMLDLLEIGLKGSSIQYRRLDGTMSVLARDKAVTEFKTLPEVTVIIMSLKAASLGLNMVAACHVILLDLWWNPTVEDQAVDRAHRIGQHRPVSVLRLTVQGTIEDRILALQQKKREMVASAFGEDETGGNQTRLTVEDLTYLFMA